jgi:hypothetical protein
VQPLVTSATVEATVYRSIWLSSPFTDRPDKNGWSVCYGRRLIVKTSAAERSRILSLMKAHKLVTLRVEGLGFIDFPSYSTATRINDTTYVIRGVLRPEEADIRP